MALGPMMMAGGIVLVALGGGAAVYLVGLRHQQALPQQSRLLGSDFGRLRRDALEMFPRGSPLADAATGLKAMGFRCTPARHVLANINAPSVQCDSAGRGYPLSPRLQVTVMARNNMIADIAIGDGFDAARADARTPDPSPVRPETAGKTDKAAAE